MPALVLCHEFAIIVGLALATPLWAKPLKKHLVSSRIDSR